MRRSDMIISFDLDDTLIPGIKRFNTERQTLFQKICRQEKIRVGTIALMKTLQAQNHKVYIYTSSLRTIRKIWFTFYLYGIKVDKIVNRRLHEDTLRNNHKHVSKYPPAFNIDIHIDDSEGVAIEGNLHNFRVIIIAENNHDWANLVLESIPK